MRVTPIGAGRGPTGVALFGTGGAQFLGTVTVGEMGEAGLDTTGSTAGDIDRAAVEAAARAVSDLGLSPSMGAISGALAGLSQAEAEVVGGLFSEVANRISAGQVAGVSPAVAGLVSAKAAAVNAAVAAKEAAEGGGEGPGGCASSYGGGCGTGSAGPLCAAVLGPGSEGPGQTWRAQGIDYGFFDMNQRHLIPHLVAIQKRRLIRDG